MDVVKDAFPRGKQSYRHWLSRIWNRDLPLALVIGINPNEATDTDDDGMTRFLTALLSELRGEYQCGGYILVNCCDIRDSEPSTLKDKAEPCSPTNRDTIREHLARCDLVVASWGTTDYGQVVAENREWVAGLLRQSAKPVICFSPKGKPVYCSPTNKNSTNGRWSDVPVAWCSD